MKAGQGIALDSIGAIRDLPVFRQRRSVPVAPFAGMLAAARGTPPAPAESSRSGTRPARVIKAPQASFANDRLGANESRDSASFGGYADLIARASSRNGVDPTLVAAVIRAESGFDRMAVSRSGAKGLMQLMDGTARSLGVSDPFDPEQNVEGGTRFLSSLLNRFGTPDLALAAYNAGPIAVATHGGIPPFRETQAYVRKVLDYQKGYQSGVVT